MQSNQYQFEVVRDIATMLGKLKPGESIAISVTRHGLDVNGSLFDWETSKGETCGMSETANAIQAACNKPITR